MLLASVCQCEAPVRLVTAGLQSRRNLLTSSQEALDRRSFEEVTSNSRRRIASARDVTSEAAPLQVVVDSQPGRRQA